ncbi:MAG: hypothetical protein QOE58_2962 [Actinomycetota bacterium]|jgi:hypothetical protein|nr:hypothetical protein [Actinomycetota bacterium]
MSEHEAGDTAQDIANRHKLGKHSVLKLLDQAGVAIRNRGLAPDKHYLVEELCSTCATTRQAAVALECSASMVKRVFHARGVTMRPACRLPVCLTLVLDCDI